MFYIFDVFVVLTVCMVSRHHVEDLHVLVAAMSLLPHKLVLTVPDASLHHLTEEVHQTSVTVEVTLCPQVFESFTRLH